MIRFEPDTWSDAALRYFAMAAPNANVYVEIPAPDVRLAAIVLLALPVFIWRKRLAGSPRAALTLWLLLLIATVPWLLTSGNGRYFIPMLLCAGPIAVGLVSVLPATRAFRLVLAAGLLALQVFVVSQSPPWGAWAWINWREGPYFQVEAPKADAQPVTYVSLSTISYSLIAPQFPVNSRWINIAYGGAVRRDASWTADFLEKAGTIKLVAPTFPAEVGVDGQPSENARQSLNGMLSVHRLRLESGARCDLLRSRSLAAFGSPSAAPDVRTLAVSGFWVCPLRFPVDAPAPTTPAVDAQTEAVFERVEAMCPRLFVRGEAATLRINGGALRQYPSSDMKVYVMEDGTVLYKFWRALNAVVIGTRASVLAGGGVVHCDRIRGRSGLPWEREI